MLGYLKSSRSPLKRASETYLKANSKQLSNFLDPLLAVLLDPSLRRDKSVDNDAFAQQVNVEMLEYALQLTQEIFQYGGS